jgi:hypothetical protein
MLKRYSVGVTCTASAATVDTYIDPPGYLAAIRYTPGTASALATGATAIISAREARGDLITPAIAQVLTFTGTSAAGLFFPRSGIHTTALASAALASGLSAMIPLANDYIRVVVASGGASGNARFEFYVDTP